MCEFVSWVERNGETKQVLFLTMPLIESKKGKELLAGLPQDDLIGHGAIRRFFGLEQDEGTNLECSDFSTPDNFPDVIVCAIKRGDMRGMAQPQELLSDPTWAEYRKICDPAWAEYQKICDPAWAEYQKISDTAWAESQKIHAPTWAEYRKICDPAWAEYQKIRDPTWAEYQKIHDTSFWGLFANPENRNPNWR